jgi:hypothetical protein
MERKGQFLRLSVDSQALGLNVIEPRNYEKWAG